MSPPEEPAPDLTRRLCAACGLCCDGTLFHGLRLQKDDSPRRLAALGLKPKRGFVPQPCPAHCGDACAIHAQRPTRCRDFSCRQLLAVRTGTRTEAEALTAIAEALALRERVRHLLRASGEMREHKALAVRCAAALTPPEDPSEDAAAARAQLPDAMEKLEDHLRRFFRVAPATDAL